jgi:sugar lactone lactonase YvrE
MWGGAVHRFDVDGRRESVLHLPGDEPGGLGWLPDGRLLVVGMRSRRLYRVEDGAPVVHADLTAFAPWPCNDMIVTADGTAFVSHFGFDFEGHTTPYQPATLLRVAPDGAVSVAAPDMQSPNGIALSADGATLVVAEPGAGRLTRFGVGPGGALSQRSTFAELTPADGVAFAPPDGICLDEAGAVWAAEPLGRRVLRVEPGGRVTHEIRFETHPLAVCLGGPGRRTLYVCWTAEYARDKAGPDPAAGVSRLPVEVPGAGRP